MGGKRGSITNEIITHSCSPILSFNHRLEAWEKIACDLGFGVFSEEGFPTF